MVVLKTPFGGKEIENKKESGSCSHVEGVREELQKTEQKEWWRQERTKRGREK